jgi:hypothetical protein
MTSFHQGMRLLKTQLLLLILQGQGESQEAHTLREQIRLSWANATDDDLAGLIQSTLPQKQQFHQKVVRKNRELAQDADKWREHQRQHEANLFNEEE